MRTELIEDKGESRYKITDIIGECLLLRETGKEKFVRIIFLTQGRKMELELRI